ncbi:MAG: hypothetical protein JJT81_18815, partial [Rubellimicrobium sp.]|nr:hypothetical protein [Rubellimicrobium sp.]
DPGRGRNPGRDRRLGRGAGVIRSAALALTLTIGSANAETVFAVTSEDLSVCNLLSQIALAAAEHRDEGRTHLELSTGPLAYLDDDVRSDILEIVFNTVEGDPGFVAKTVAGLCVLERLQPREIN